MESQHVSIKVFERDIITKAKEYIKTTRAKQAIYHYKGYDGILEMRGKGLDLNHWNCIQEQKYAEKRRGQSEIRQTRRDAHPFSYGDTMNLNHLIAIICYADLTELCTKWTSTFRQIHIGESRAAMKLRQASYYHLSKYLYQIVQYFGVYCHGTEDPKTEIYVSFCDESGPFFCGMNHKMPFPSFNVKLNCPTSTSRHKEVALRFSGEDGILIQFNNTGLTGHHSTAFFDASWISRYKEEDEVYVIL